MKMGRENALCFMDSNMSEPVKLALQSFSILFENTMRKKKQNCRLRNIRSRSYHLSRKRIISVILFSTLIAIPFPCFPQYLGKCYYRNSEGISIRYIGGYPRAKLVTLPVAEAVPEKFQLISDSPSDNCGTSSFFGGDGVHVFFRNMVIEGVEPSTFQAYDGGYSADRTALFFRNEKIPRATPQNFHTVPIPYSTSFYGVAHSGILYKGRFIQAKVDVGTFTPLGGRWIKDRHHVYLRDNAKPVKGADAATIKVVKPLRKRQMNLQWAMDNTNVYHITKGGVKTIKGADPHSFTLINSNYAKDRSQVYYHGQLVIGADAATFTVPRAINGHTGYDKYRKYHLGKAVSN